MDIKVISIEEQAFYMLVNKVVAQVVKKLDEKALSKWIDTAEAMSILKITSRTTLQKLRDTGAIRFSQPEKKIILYDRDSIIAYIEKHVRDTF